MKSPLEVERGLYVPSPSLRGRGLKYAHLLINDCGLWSPSLRGRGLKSMSEYEEEDIKLWSPSLRGRGLKSTVVTITNIMD